MAFEKLTFNIGAATLLIIIISHAIYLQNAHLIRTYSESQLRGAFSEALRPIENPDTCRKNIKNFSPLGQKIILKSIENANGEIVLKEDSDFGSAVHISRIEISDLNAGVEAQLTIHYRTIAKNIGLNHRHFFAKIKLLLDKKEDLVGCQVYQ